LRSAAPVRESRHNRSPPVALAGRPG